MKSLLKRWKSEWRPDGFPIELEPAIADWQAQLTEQKVVMYCAAIQAYILRIFFSSIVLQNEKEPGGQIEAGKTPPYFEVLAHEGSPLANQTNVEPNTMVKIGANMFAQHVSQRCKISLTWGELVWWFVVGSLDEPGSVLPALDIQNKGGSTFDVRRASPTDDTEE
jgi:hypothetical protein